nr:immunoglobulin light chain junction region [Macaca mulatta]MPN92634.1 immunoglobulin light chain junction region [Macaca mulatta]MPN92795.1 immunoglobulin light chain junction region [Macaca mulatta]MPN94475.1 immunoglobulin light chain junction region [Macaca mulatta]MPN94570.1 immunoglobulin light chain junction region [Macaca mulatta]
CQHYYSTPYIF